MDFGSGIGKFAQAVVALLIVLDPIGLAPVLVGLSRRFDEKQFRRLILKVVAGSTLLLLLFTATGTWVLRLFGVTLNDLQIGGGLLLLIAVRLVVEGRLLPDTSHDEQAVVVPLISPLLIGPGAITAAVVLAALHGVVLTALAGLAAMAVCLLVFVCTRLVHRLLGDSGTDLISRIMGLLIATIAISYIRAGVLGLIETARQQ